MNNSMNLRLMTLAVLCAALGAVGCSDDDAPAPANDSGTGSLDANMTGTDAGHDANQPNNEAGIVDSGPGGMCLSTSDMQALGFMNYQDAGKTTANVAADCAIAVAILGSYRCDGGTQEQCVTQCFAERTEMRLSAGCTGCVLLGVQCAQTNCIGDCASDPNSLACQRCQCGLTGGPNCRAMVAACTGIPTTACDFPDAGAPATDAGPGTTDAGTDAGPAT